jgi:hypothetical protein
LREDCADLFHWKAEGKGDEQESNRPLAGQNAKDETFEIVRMPKEK